ncbi:MAG: tRNA pseudouridine(38-40) synthase TruA [Gammaproteobacteria bacterium]
MRIAMGLEYCGRDFNGWQRLKKGRSVQGCVESAISRIANHEIKLGCAGRTDSGVHASHQVIHFDTDAKRSAHAWVMGTNSNLPADVSILWAKFVDTDFHARFSAVGRSYRYVILNRMSRPGMLQGLVSWEYRLLNSTLMQNASRCLIGEHDFNAYRALKCQAKSSVRKIRRLEVEQYNDWITIDINANAFLHHMVRNIAGVLMMIGMGKAPVTWAEEVLHSQDRTQGGVTATPDGLYLTEVDYALSAGIPPAPVNKWPG